MSETPESQSSELLPDKKPFAGAIRVPNEQDLEALRPILETWIRDSETHELKSAEVAGVLEAIQADIAGKGEVSYLVAEEEGRPIGVIGFRKLIDERLKAFAETDNPAELVNAYVEASRRAGRGVGKALLAKLEEAAKAKGFKEILLKSGQRYENTGWGFYDKVYGEPVGLMTDYYGEGKDAPAWQKVLVENASEKEINFERIFRERWDAIGKWGMPNYPDLKDAGVAQIRKLAPAVIFHPQEEIDRFGVELWTSANPRIVGDIYPHSMLEGELKQKLGTKKYPFAIPSYVIEDDKGIRTIFIAVKTYKESIKARAVGEKMDEYDRKSSQALLDTFKKYGIHRIGGYGGGGHYNFYGQEDEHPPEALMELFTSEKQPERDVVGELREATYQYSFAEKHQMTNTQWIRFHALISAAQKAGQSTVYEKIAQEVLDQDREKY
jgi:ribosomal protein S18 acetylase RimI-like enzyme